MNKNILIGTLSLIVLISGALWITQGRPADALTQDYMTAKYEVEGEIFELETGDFEYFGNEVWADFNNDGREDVAFIISRSVEGMGQSFYATAAFNLEEGFEGMNAVYLGNNISPQSTNYGDNIVVINFAENNQGESFDESSIGASTFLLVSNTGLQQVGYQSIDQAAGGTFEAGTEEAEKGTAAE